MNWKSFGALFWRDIHVARRNLAQLALQTLLQPLLFVFVFGRIMIRSGLMASSYRAMLLPGIIAVSMLMTGLQAVSMPLIAEFQFTREIEDRLLAPIRSEWLAIEKVGTGMIQALFAGMVVIPAGLLLLGMDTGITFTKIGMFLVIMVLVALLAASGGLVIGCSMGQTHIGLIFTLVIAPMIMFGCAYYPWAALKDFPVVRIAVLANPMVYASEGLRGALAPEIPHIPLSIVVGALCVLDAALIAFGLNRFSNKAVG